MIPPNAKSCKILKDKFYLGAYMDLKNESVHDVAWILKVGKFHPQDSSEFT